MKLAPIEDLQAQRKAIHEAQHTGRATTKAAAEAEERAQVAALARQDASNEAINAMFAKAETENRMVTLEEINASGMNRIEMLHASIKLGRQLEPANVIPTGPANKAISARTLLEMEAGKRSVERAQGQRDREMARGAEVATGSPATPVGELPTPSTPVYVPNKPVPGIDQNKPMKMRRGG